MSDKEKAELLDNFEYRLLSEDLIETSLEIEEFADLKPDMRWVEVSSYLREKEVVLPEDLECFLSEQPEWDLASEALSS